MTKILKWGILENTFNWTLTVSLEHLLWFVVLRNLVYFKLLWNTFELGLDSCQLEVLFHHFVIEVRNHILYVLFDVVYFIFVSIKRIDFVFQCQYFLLIDSFMSLYNELTHQAFKELHVLFLFLIVFMLA